MLLEVGYQTHFSTFQQNLLMCTQHLYISEFFIVFFLLKTYVLQSGALWKVYFIFFSWVFSFDLYTHTYLHHSYLVVSTNLFFFSKIHFFIYLSLLMVYSSLFLTQPLFQLRNETTMNRTAYFFYRHSRILWLLPFVYDFFCVLCQKNLPCLSMFLFGMQKANKHLLY